MANDNGKDLPKMNQTLNAGKLNTETIMDNQTQKRKRNTEEDSELIEQLYKLFEEEKQKSTFQTNELSEMRKQLTILTRNVADLNDLIKNLQAEKSE